MKNLKKVLLCILILTLLSGCSSKNSDNNINDENTSMYEEVKDSLIKEEVRNIVNTIDTECLFREMGTMTVPCKDGQTILNNLDSFNNLAYYFEDYEILNITYIDGKVTNLETKVVKNEKRYIASYDLSEIKVELDNN